MRDKLGSMECQELPWHLPSYLMWYSMITHTRAFHSGILIYKYFLHFLTPLWTGIKSPLYSGAINPSAAGQLVLLQITHWNTSRVWKTPSMSLRNTVSIKSRHVLLMLGQTLWAGRWHFLCHNLSEVQKLETYCTSKPSCACISSCSLCKWSVIRNSLPYLG